MNFEIIEFRVKSVLPERIPINAGKAAIDKESKDAKVIIPIRYIIKPFLYSWPTTVMFLW